MPEEKQSDAVEKFLADRKAFEDRKQAGSIPSHHTFNNLEPTEASYHFIPKLMAGFAFVE